MHGLHVRAALFVGADTIPNQATDIRSCPCVRTERTVVIFHTKNRLRKEIESTR